MTVSPLSPSYDISQGEANNREKKCDRQLWSQSVHRWTGLRWFGILRLGNQNHPRVFQPRPWEHLHAVFMLPKRENLDRKHSLQKVNCFHGRPPRNMIRLHLSELEHRDPGRDRCSTSHLAFQLWPSAPKQTPRRVCSNYGIVHGRIMMHLAGPCSGNKSGRTISCLHRSESPVAFLTPRKSEFCQSLRIIDS